jgi:amidase
VKKVMEDALARIERAGGELEEGWPPGVNATEHYHTYRFILASYFESPLPGDSREKMIERCKQDGTFESFEAWGWNEPRTYQEYKAATYAKMHARELWQSYFKTRDAFLLPASFVTAFPHDHSRLKDRVLKVDGKTRKYEDLLFWICFATVTGLPATVAPIGIAENGMPVGLQIMGPYLEDATTIDIAGRVGEMCGGFRVPPGY